MRVVVPSLLGLALICSTAWAIEPAPAPAPVVTPAVQATTATPSSQTLPANKPGIMPAVATVNPNGLPQEAKPLTAEQLAKNKAKKVPILSKTLVNKLGFPSKT